MLDLLEVDPNPRREPMNYYPKSATYFTGIECPQCGTGADEQCRTTGGNLCTQPVHAARRKAALAVGVTLTEHGREDHEPLSPSQQLKLALWYVEKAGGVDNAKRWFAAAVVALEVTKVDPSQLGASEPVDLGEGSE